MSKDNKNNYVVIMAGGVGSRFWPLSKKSYPKQFHDILGIGKSLLRLTYERYLPFVDNKNIYVITNSSYTLLVSDQLPDLPVENIIDEPAAMNTAPCVAYASFKIFAKNPDANIVFAPSDHLIIDEKTFRLNIKNALDFVSSNNLLLTLGIKPNRPDTGYGYIQHVDKEEIAGQGIYKVKTFTEKPSLELAQTFIESGDFLWNSGIFIWKAVDILNEFSIHQNDMYEIFKKGLKKYNTPDEAKFINKNYPLCKNISIDYAIMEKTSIAGIMHVDFGWSDLGTWKSLYMLRDKDENNNMIHGQIVDTYNTKNCLIMQEDSQNKLVVIEGLENMLVVDTHDILFISHLEKEQEVRQITSDIKEKYKGRFT
ncbi:MAG: mannose-1-phosphate guanylyltransferase [Bacteroidota bacterium]|nr:mannose-1-phosphate guanylyltransferase [Bacteroidota bacterium]